MPRSSKDQRAGAAGTRRSSRVKAADSTFETDTTNSAFVSLSDRPTRIAPKARAASTSSSSEQAPARPSKSAESDPVQHGKYKPKDPSKQLGNPIALTRKIDEDTLNYILKPIEMEERERWKGWCEVESEPAFFNVMLREFGVDGIKVQEVLGLDEELLAFLPKPIYGLIFLFQFQDDDPTKQEATCPDHIWFANQTTSNACASIALLNIVMNIPDIELGPTLEALKNFTATMNPAMCGYQVCNHDYIRQVHNSFTRKIDMLNADLALSNDASAKKSKKKAESLKNIEEEQDQAGFHFIAFVPIQGCVWKLDGLERQPMNLGTFDQDWMDLARPLIEERMQQYEGNQIQFNLLALCKSPLISIPTELAVNVKTLSAVENQLSRLQSDWKQFIGESESDSVIYGPNPIYKLTQELLDSAQLPKAIMTQLGNSTTTAQNLFQLRQELIAAQAAFRAGMIDEESDIDKDNERALSRRNDYTPMIHAWLRFLASNATLKGLAEAVEQ